MYIPDRAADELLPVVFNLHGGAFIAGDADTLDTQSDRIAKDWDAVVVTVNYVTAWFMWHLQEDTEAAKAFIGDDPELLQNPLYQDQKINVG